MQSWMTCSETGHTYFAVARSRSFLRKWLRLWFSWRTSSTTGHCRERWSSFCLFAMRLLNNVHTRQRIWALGGNACVPHFPSCATPRCCFLPHCEHTKYSHNLKRQMCIARVSEIDSLSTPEVLEWGLPPKIATLSPHPPPTSSSWSLKYWKRGGPLVVTLSLRQEQRCSCVFLAKLVLLWYYVWN